MTQHAGSRETRAIGWYAVQWVHVTDWFKVYTGRLHRGQHQPPIVPTLGQEHLVRRPTTKSESAPLTLGQSDNTSEAKTEVKTQDETKAEEYQKLKTVAKESQGILAKVDSVFPLTLLPDTLTIDRHKVAITYRTFFRIAQEVSVPIETVKNIQADVGPFFGSVTITSDNFINNTQTIRFLKRSDVKLVQNLIQGAMVAVKENIDISKVETEKLRKQLMRLGEAHHE